MKKMEALNHFMRWLDDEALEFEQRVMSYIQVNQADIIDQFRTSFISVSKEVSNKQTNQRVEEISYVSYSISYINFLTKQPLYLIEVFDKDWFFSHSIHEGVYDPSWLTDRLYKFYDNALKQHKKYVQKINPVEVEKYMLLLLDRQIKHLMRIVQGILNEKDIAGVELKTNKLTITIGNYRGLFQTLYEEKVEKVI